MVTAQRREQRAQKVGISIVALSAKQLRQQNIRSSEQLVQAVPGVRMPEAGSGVTSSFSIRGVQQSDYGASQEPPVAVYLDDVYQASQGTSQFLLYDLNRVEILRGPQGTLFGRNATGGLVAFYTEKPTDQYEGYAQVSYGRFNDVKPEAAVNIPLSSDLFARFSLSADYRDPIVQNTTGKDLWNANKIAGRLQVLWQPSDDFSFLLNGHTGDARETGQPYIWAAARPTGPYGTGVLTPGLPDDFGFRNTGNGVFRVSIDPVSYHYTFTDGVTGTLKWTMPWATLTAVTDVTHVRVGYEEDSDMEPGEYFHFLNEFHTLQFSEELRLNGTAGPLTWTAGGYVLDDGGRFEQQGREAAFFALLGVPGVTTETTPYSDTTLSGSIFGQVEYHLNDQFTLISGGRLVDENKSQDYDAAFYNTPGGTKVAFGSSPDLLTFNGSLSEKLYALKEELDWTPDANQLVYASYSRGVKAGGFNAPLDPSGAAIFINPVTYNPAPTAYSALFYKPETLHAFEIGEKTTFLGGRARLNVSAFYYDYKDYQIFNFSGVSTSYLTNNPATIKGFDSELEVSPLKGLTVTAGISYLQDVVDDVAIGPAVVHRDLPYAPKWSAAGVVRYEWPAFGGRMSAEANANYVSSQFFSLTNAQDTFQGGYVLANAQASFTFPDGRTSLAAYIDNIGNQLYKVVAFDTASAFGSAENQYGLPRMFGFTLRRAFGAR